ncbi:MAG: CvpA family protein [Bacteroidales bacterium]|nr:CvpA family protein [Bacteroidales bacterium]
MNILDIALGIPMLVLIYLGWKKGLVREVATLVGLLLGIWAAVHLSQQVAMLLELESENAILIAFIITFLAALVLTYLLGRFVEGLMKAARISMLNRLAGALLGLAKALCVLAVLLNYIVLLDRKELVLKHDTKEESLLFKPVYDTGNRLTDSLKQFIEETKNKKDTITPLTSCHS